MSFVAKNRAHNKNDIRTEMIKKIQELFGFIALIWNVFIAWYGIGCYVGHFESGNQICHSFHTYVKIVTSSYYSTFITLLLSNNITYVLLSQYKCQ